MLSLALMVMAAAPGTETFEWKLVTGGGRPDQVLYVLTGNSPTPRHVMGNWKLTLEPADESGHRLARLHTRTRSVETTETWELWERDGVWVFRAPDAPSADVKPAVEREAPPHALSMERVFCRSALLGYAGECTGAAGGPLASPLFPLSFTVEAGRRPGLVEQLVVPLMTGGLLVPGYTNTSVVAHLVPRAPVLSAELLAWKKSKKRAADLPASLDVETAGAALVLAGKPSVELVSALLTRLTLPTERWPLLRLAQERGLAPRDTLQVVALTSADGALLLPASDEALFTSATSGLDVLTVRGVRALLSGGAPNLRAHLTGKKKATEADTLTLLTSASLEAAEAGALAMTLSAPTRHKAMAKVLDALSADEGVELLQQEARGGRDGNPVVLLGRAPAWVDRMVREGHAERVGKLLSFDDDRAKVLDASLARLTPEDVERQLPTVLRAFSFDDERVKLLTKWRAAVVHYDAARALSVLEAFEFSQGSTKALSVLLETLSPEVSRPLLFSALEKASFDGTRDELLARVPVPTTAADALALTAAYTSEGGIVRVSCSMLAKLPVDERQRFLLASLKRLRLDKLKLLECADVATRTLPPAQREQVLRSVPTWESGKAAALLP